MIGLSYINEGYPNLSSARPSQPDAVQMMIGRWLSEEAGLEPHPTFVRMVPTDLDGPYWFPQSDEPEPAWSVEVDAAVGRFALLSEEDQRAWLNANWDALRDGELALEDLP